MKVLFGSFRYDPADLNRGSGFDYDWYSVFKKNNIENQILGPFPAPNAGWEELFNSLYKKVTGLRYAKFRISGSLSLSRKLNQAVASYQPDVVFTIWPIFLVFYRANKPAIYAVDTCLYGQQTEMPLYGKLAMKITEWEEQRAFKNAACIIAHSEWTKNIIVKRYSIPSERIQVFPVPSSLPLEAIPRQVDIRSEKQIQFPLRLLLVGRVYHRKGVDIAIEIAKILNQKGISAELTICGLKEKSDLPFVKFVGPFKKTDSAELKEYTTLYKQAHFLLHPARFEAAGIVPSEAAAFGTPTITNDVGGLATTVADGVSGIVLPKASPAERYVQTIMELINDPERYYQLCQSTRERYERELNWEVAGKNLMELMSEVVAEHKRKETN